MAGDGGEIIPERPADTRLRGGWRLWRFRERRPRLRPALDALLQRALGRATEAPLTYGNRAAVLVDGPVAYPAMLELIASARRRVHFENYIFRDDEAGRHFAEALAERARAGVEVRVLYDWFGSFGTGRSFWAKLRRAGCEVRPFGPPSLRRPLSILKRDHRKLVVVDGRAGVVGGLCIGNEWMERGSEPCWRDTAVRLDGPIAVELERSFARLWRHAGGSALPRPETRPGEAGDVVARVVDGPPSRARAYRLYQVIAALAERTLYLTGAYPLAPETLRVALTAAARGGVDVRLLAPGRSDVPLLNQAARVHYGDLLRAGVRVYEWSGPMLHAKTVVADGKWALVGSSNLNPFSLLGSYELDVEIQDEQVAGALETQFLRDLERAREITFSDWAGRPGRQRWAEQLGAAILWLPYKLYSG